MSPGRAIFIPRGNLAFGCFAARDLFVETRFSMKPLRFRILPIVLGEVVRWSGSKEHNLYFDHAGYRFLSFMISRTIAGEVIGLRM
jgi:hypothetical protein